MEDRWGGLDRRVTYSGSGLRLSRDAGGQTLLGAALAAPTLFSRHLLLEGFKVPFASLCCTWSEPQALWFLINTRKVFCLKYI